MPRCSSASRLLSLWGKTGPGRPCLGCARRKFLAPALRPALAANLAWPCLHQCGIPHPYGWNRPISQIILEIAGIPSGSTANSENHMARTRGNGISYIALAPLPPILPGPYHHVHNPNRLEGNGQFPHLPGTRYTNQQTRHPSPHRFSNWRGFHTFSNPCHTRFYSLTPPQSTTVLISATPKPRSTATTPPSSYPCRSPSTMACPLLLSLQSNSRVRAELALPLVIPPPNSMESPTTALIRSTRPV